MKNDDFLKEIQKKINKRSGGYYYNSRAKNLKRNFYVTIVALFVVFGVFFIIRVASIGSIEKILTKNVSVKKENMKLEKEGVRYILDLKVHTVLQDYFKGYTFIKKDNKVVYLVPPKDRREIIRLMLKREIRFKEENYLKKGFFYQFVFK